MAHRTFSDLRGVTWEVWDVYPRIGPTTAQGEVGRTTVTGVLAQGWLAFQSGESRRRLAPIPVRWDDAADEQLGRWCTQAAIVGPRHRTSAPEKTASP